MAFRTRTTSGPKPNPTLLTKYSPQTRPASNLAVCAVTSRRTARTGLCRYTPASLAKSFPLPIGTTPSATSPPPPTPPVTQQSVRHVVHGAVAAHGHDPLRPSLHRARRELRAVARSLGALHLHRPPLVVELARDGIERAARRAAAGRGVEHDVGVDQRLHYTQRGPRATGRYDRVTVYWPQAVNSMVTVVDVVPLVTTALSFPESNRGSVVQLGL